MTEKDRINVDTEILDDIAKDDKKQRRAIKNSKAAWIVIGIIVGLAVIAAIVFFIIKGAEKQGEEPVTEEEKQEAILDYDGLYEAGAYENMVAAVNDNLDRVADISEWEHFGFYENYSYYLSIKQIKDDYAANGRMSNIDKNILFYDGLYFYYRDYNKDDRLSDSDKEVLESVRDMAINPLYEMFGLNDDMLNSIEKECRSAGSLSFTQCETVAEKFEIAK